jgi:hypothetical protein
MGNPAPKRRPSYGKAALAPLAIGNPWFYRPEDPS